MWAIRRRLRTIAALVGMGVLVLVGSVPHAGAESYQRISGEGSSWAANAIDAMRVNVKQFGVTVDYNPSGSSSGRKNWLNGTVDFAASDIPFQFQPEDGSAPERPAAGTYAYIPVTAGGTAFMYNLKINGRRVTNLRLSGGNVAKIFTGVLTQWNDPALAADNPGLALPARQIVPVVRSDGSGSSAQFTKWLIAQHGGLWQDYCQRSGRAPACGFTSYYPTVRGMIAKAGDLGVASHVVNSTGEGSIGYVNYSYALGAGFPVAKVLNAAGYYTEPTPKNVAVSLLQARINRNSDDPTVYLTQELEGVYTDTDPRNYQLSSYSYFVLPTKITKERANFTEEKGRTLGFFAYYAMCQAQQQSESLGYSPMPINLVDASFEQIRLIPGVEVQNINIRDCKNPTFSSDGTNVLAANAPQPKDCDRQGPNQCPDGTAGASRQPTAVNTSASGGQTSVGGSASGGGSTSGGAASGGGTTSDRSGTAVSGSGGAGGTTATSGLGGGGGSSSLSGGPGSATSGRSDEPFCDPDTGICGSAVAGDVAIGELSGEGSELVAAGAAAAVPSYLSASSGWSATETLITVVVLLLLGLVIAPAVLWRRLSDTRTSP